MTQLRRRLMENGGDPSTFKPFTHTDDMWVLICSILVGLSALFLIFRIAVDCFLVESGHEIKRSTVSARIEEQKKARAAKLERKRREKEMRAQQGKRESLFMKNKFYKGGKRGQGRPPPPSPDQNGQQRKGPPGNRGRPPPNNGNKGQRVPSKSSEEFELNDNRPAKNAGPRRQNSVESTGSAEIVRGPNRSRSTSAEPNKMRSRSRSADANRNRNGPKPQEPKKMKKGNRPGNASSGELNTDKMKKQDSYQEVSKPVSKQDDDDSDSSSEYVTGPVQSSVPNARQQPPKQRPVTGRSDESSISSNSDDSYEELPARPAQVNKAKPAPPQNQRKPAAPAAAKDDDSSMSSVEPSSEGSFEEMPPRPAVKKKPPPPKNPPPRKPVSKNGGQAGLISKSPKRAQGPAGANKKVAVKGFLGKS